jgi:hypothetical protein
LEELIAAEVPLGCNRQQAEAWFDQHGIEHDYCTDTTGDRAGDRTMPMLAGLRDQDLGGMVRGWIPPTEAEDPNMRITAYFFLDKQGRCVGHLVHPFVYSL